MKPEVQYLLENYTGEKFFVEDGNRERSAEPEEYDGSYTYLPRPKRGVAYSMMPQGFEIHGSDFAVAECASGIQDGMYLQFAQNAVPHIGIHAPLNAQQRQHIRTVSRNLKTIADSMQIRPSNTSARQVQTESLDENELQVVNNIYSVRNVTTVSTIAGFLEKKLTSHTIRIALQFLCDSVSNTSEELAVVCELVKLTAPKLRELARSNSVNEVISEFIEERLPRVD